MWSVSAEVDHALRLLSDSASRWRSLRAAGREWRHEARLHQAFRRGTPPGAVTIESVGPPVPDEREERWSVWIEQPGRRRAEFAVGTETVVVVFHGHTWWSWAPMLGARTNGGRRNSGHGVGPSQGLIETALLPPAFRFEWIGEERCLERAALLVRAVPAPLDGPTPSLAHHVLGTGADEHLLTIDAERGMLLRAEARSAGEPFRVIEMTEVAFDEELPPGTFEIELPPGMVFDDIDLATQFRLRRPR